MSTNLSNQNLARCAGFLFLLQLIPYYIGHEEILGAILYQDPFPEIIDTHRSRVAFAVLLELISAFAFIAFSVILYHFLRKVNDLIALLYLGIRFVEFAIIVLSEIKLLSLVSIAKRYVSADGDQLALLEEMGRVTLYEWQWVTLVYMMVFCVNALFFYFLLFKSRLVPRFISIWGGIGAILAISTPIVLLYGKPAAGFIIYAPIGFNELFLALWLIVKGFSFEKREATKTIS